MAIIGWLTCVVIVVMLSIFAFLCLVNNGGQYTIGGAVNSASTKIGTFVFIGFVGYLWYLVDTHAPFTVTMN
jgi:hypothetical protein